MTRINCGIDPKILTTPHLNAEAREIKRIPNMVKTGRAKLTDIPAQFTLGKGHVKFWYTRLKYLLERYKAIHEEQVRRGFNVQDFSSAWDGVPSHLMNDYTPTEQDRGIVMERLVSKDIIYAGMLK